MSPFDDDEGVRTSHDDQVLAGQATTSDDVALVELVTALRESARRPAPSPTPELAALLALGTPAAVGEQRGDPTSTTTPADVVPVAAGRPTRGRVARVAAGAGLVAALAAGGTAAAAAQDGVAVPHLPAAVWQRAGDAVSGALRLVGVDLPAAAPAHADDVPADGAVDPSGADPVRPQDTPGRPAGSGSAGQPDDAAGRDEAQAAVPAQRAEPGSPATPAVPPTPGDGHADPAVPADHADPAVPADPGRGGPGDPGDAGDPGDPGRSGDAPGQGARRP